MGSWEVVLLIVLYHVCGSECFSSNENNLWFSRFDKMKMDGDLAVEQILLPE